MKLKSIIAIFMAVMLISSQAFAAACSTACLEMQDQQTHSHQSIDQHADADHCDHGSNESEQDSSSSKDTTCSMAGCHLAQTVVFACETAKPAIQASDSNFPQFISTAVTADQPPPIKPPA